MFLDGIRYASGIADLAYRRLCDTLNELTHNVEQGNGQRMMVSAIADAWSVIDTVDRLRGLIMKATFFREGSRGRQEFLEATGPIRKLRNTVQHLDSLIPKLAGEGWPAWGVLSWVVWRGPTTPVCCCLLPGGYMKERPFRMHVPSMGDDHEPVTHVSLGSRGVEVSLTDAHRIVASALQQIESGVELYLKGNESTLPRRNNDFLLQIELDLTKAGAG
ncbi:MAG: hypothetical protein K0S79_177 [Nitrospira sp.]|nr:hypothetical protein [Nitrospira sp.]